MGLCNVRHLDDVQLLFGEEYGVNVYSTVGQGTDVEITIPANYS